MAANIIALEFDQDEVRVVTAANQGKHTRVRYAFAVGIESDDSETQIGDKIKSALSTASISKGDAIVAVNRAHVEIREIKVPPVPDNELPALVRFNSKSSFASVTENWSLDFVPLSGSTDSERELLASALSPQESERFSKICEAAGLKLKHIVLRPFATIDLLGSELTSGELCMIVDPNGNETDLTLVNGRQVLTTRTVRSNAGGDLQKLLKQMTTEIQRTMVSATRRVGNRKLGKIVVTGGKEKYGSFVDAFTTELEASTSFVDPFERIDLKGPAPQSPEKYSALVGSLVQVGKSQPHGIDFLNPRKPVVERKDFRREMLIGGLVAMLALCGIFWAWTTLNTQKKTIESRRKVLQRMKNENEGKDVLPAVDEVVGEVEIVDKWINKSPNWLDELELMSQKTLDADHVILDKFFGVVGSTKTYINIKGRIKEHSTNTEMKTLLAERYLIDPKASTQNGKDGDYPVIMEHNLDLQLDLEDTKARIDGMIDKFGESSSDAVAADPFDDQDSQ